MIFLKLNELNAAPVIINLAQVEMVTPITGSRAKLWFSVDGEDAMEVEESLEDITEMINAAMSYPGVVSKENVAAVVR